MQINAKYIHEKHNYNKIVWIYYFKLVVGFSNCIYYVYYLYLRAKYLLFGLFSYLGKVVKLVPGLTEGFTKIYQN